MKKSKSAVACFGAYFALFIPNHTALSQTPRTTNGWFQLFQARNDFAWSGADQATNYIATNSHIYWLFGDVILGTRNPTTGGYDSGWYKLIANSILMNPIPATFHLSVSFFRGLANPLIHAFTNPKLAGPVTLRKVAGNRSVGPGRCSKVPVGAGSPITRARSFWLESISPVAYFVRA
jgi:hypothetical protein